MVNEVEYPNQCAFVRPGLSSPHCPGMGMDPVEPPTTAALPTDVRLPLNFYPIHYNLELRSDMYGPDPENFTFDGTVEIFLKCRNATNIVVLHINQLTVQNSTIDFRPRFKDGPSWTHWEEDKARQFFKLYLTDNCVVEREYVMQLTFDGKLTDDLAGLYRSSYKEGNKTR